VAFSRAFARAFTIAALGLAAISASLPAGAEPTFAERETANRLMDKADELVAAKDYEGALKLYQQADAIMGVPTTSIEVAKTELELGHLLEAWEAAKKAVDYPQKPGEPPPFTRARTEATALADKIAARLPEIEIRVEGARPGALLEVTIDGVLVSGAPSGPHKLNPGKHTVTVSAPGSEPATQTAVLAEGQRRTLVVPLGAAGASSANADDKASSGPSPLVYIGFGVGGAGLVVGAITGIMSLTKASSVKDECLKTPQPSGDQITCPSRLQGDIDASLTLANVSNVSIGVGLAGVAVGVVGLLVSGKPAPKKPASTSDISARVYMTPLAGGGALGVTGRW